MSRLRLGVLALPVVAAMSVGCFAGDSPTEQVGGTQYGLLLNTVSPVRVPTMVIRPSEGNSATTLQQITATLTNFKPLASPAAYQFYVVGVGPGDTVPVTAALSRIRYDSVATGAGGVTVTRTVTPLGTSSFFAGTQNNDTVTANFTVAPFNSTSRRWLVVTIQPNQAAPSYTAATPQPVWRNFRATTAPFNVPATPDPLTSFFGNFDITQPRVYSGAGRGRSAFWDINRDGRLVYQAIVEQVTQPPRGYFYQGWLRDTRTRRAFQMSEMVDGQGRSLFDADQLNIPGSVAQLPVGRFGITEQDVGQPLNSFDGVHLILEPKLGVDTLHALATVLQGIVGDTIGLRALGAIEVVVQQGGAGADSARVVVVPKGGVIGIGQPRPAITAATGASRGRTIITALPAGPVELIVTPKGSTTPLATRPAVTVLPRDTVTVTMTLP